MRILHVISSVRPEVGGPIEGVLRRAEVLVRMGHEITIACMDDASPEKEITAQATIFRFGPVRSNYGFCPPLYRWLRLHAQEFDAVIVNGLWQFHGLAVRFALRGTKVPYFVFTHGMLDPWFKITYPLKHIKKWLYWPWGEYRVLRDARYIFFTSEEERRLARESFWLYRANERVVPYGIAPPEGDPEAQRELLLARHPELAGKRVILFLGRLHVKKGCDLLISAFARVCSTDPKMHLLMAGPDAGGMQAGLIESCRRLGIHDRVTWAGMLGGNLKWGAFHCASVFALPSHQENFGIAVAEALSCGLPALVSNKVNIWREVIAEQAGLADDDDAGGTERLLRQWLTLTDQQIEQMRLNARSCYEKYFTADRSAAGLLQAISDKAS